MDSTAARSSLRAIWLEADQDHPWLQQINYTKARARVQLERTRYRAALESANRCQREMHHVQQGWRRIVEPIARFKSYALGVLRPLQLLIYEDRVESYKPNLLRPQSRAIPFSKVAAISVNESLAFAELVVESSGGDVLKVPSLQKRDAHAARELILARLK